MTLLQYVIQSVHLGLPVYTSAFKYILANNVCAAALLALPYGTDAGSSRLSTTESNSASIQLNKSDLVICSGVKTPIGSDSSTKGTLPNKSIA